MRKLTFFLMFGWLKNTVLFGRFKMPKIDGLKRHCIAFIRCRLRSSICRLFSHSAKRNVFLAMGMSILLISSGFSVERNVLAEISDAIALLAEKTKPAAVSIQCTLCKHGPETMSPYDMFGDDFFRKFFGPQFPQGNQPQTSGGSGFLISSDGYIVTNNHVIQDASEVKVTLEDGREFTALVKGADARTDLAVLKIEAFDLPFLQFGDSDLLKPGEMVFALGNPFGLEGTITSGIVSAKGRQGLGVVTYEDFIQTDAPINPGNSGGPLLNVYGEVVGINSMIYSRSGGYMGIGFAIPSRMARPIVEQIMESGSVHRAFLGISLQPIDKELSDALDLQKVEGVLVSDIIPGSPAEKAGLKPGDIILGYDGKKVKNLSSFRNDIALMTPGKTVELKILRKGKKQTLKVVLGSQDDEGAHSKELSNKLGIDLENLTPDLANRLGYSADVTGVVISKVKPDSVAARAGLRPYFLITGIATEWNDQKQIRNVQEFDEALKATKNKKYVILIVRHQNFQRYYTIKMND